ncbi:hemagglutinin repeat-containing protein [Pseudomonas sp. CDFA 602]|uniref:hemagglutinin repeat-containing protein n=1 Tax=Pseudomonas californiensis TaxID=2829823 RepID=UPI001E459896|nr:hemagglutinin repeat-containing protein [Pseudomonas californiensis]MCD5997362.1 hemagglutinin repeat-containing protein [Pseudomonas californiensis]MCD6002977.1 hemagglutinin repeat-containing protein [Pseudomonas californiensis]
MDVRSLTLQARQPSADLPGRQRFWGLPKRGLALILANALFWQPLLVQAEGIAVSGGTNTSVGQAGNGVPVINIAAPNGSGLSHNQYQQYNVDSKGVILNNATQATQNTQLGGIIVGNGNLNGQAASTILNEVVGANASQLKGYTEVAGQGARVIVANPYGITCNGCGFINTPRVTLSTGKPILDGNGQLDRFNVQGGSISIDGTGLNADNVDQFDIITRSAKINARLQAKKLNIIAGRNDVNDQTLEATPLADDGSAKPELAIDSSALGGMYAGAVKLVGTEAGVGVKLAGDLAASGGDIQIDANGKLTMNQSAASGNIVAKARDITVTGPAYAAGQLALSASGTLDNSKDLVAGQSIVVQAGQLKNTGVIESGVNADNTRNRNGTLSVQARNLVNQGTLAASSTLGLIIGDTLDNRAGKILSEGSLDINAARLDNNKGLLSSAGAQTVNVSGGLVNSSGQLVSDDALTVSSARVTNDGGTFSAAKPMSITTAQLDNDAKSRITGGDNLALNATVLNNLGGLLSGAKGLSFDGDTLNNTGGTLVSNGGITLDLIGTLTNTNGQVISGSDLLVRRSAQVNNQNGRLSSQGLLTLLTTDLDNRNKGTLAGSTVAITSRGTVQNGNDGLIYSQNGTLDLTANTLNNDKGTLQSNGSMTLASGALSNVNGSIVAQKGDLTVTGASLDNTAGALGSLAGQVRTDLSGLLRNGKLDARRGVIQGRSLLLAARGGIDNTGGDISAQGGDALIQTASFTNRDGALSGGLVQVRGNSFSNSGGEVSGSRIDFDLSSALDNRQGIIESSNGFALKAASVDNSRGKLRALGTSGSSSLTLTGVLNNTNGQLESANTDLQVAVGSLINTGGSILHVGNGTLDLGLPLLQNAGGSLTTNGSLKLTGDSWTNSTTLQAASLEMDIKNFRQLGGGRLLAGTRFVGRGENWVNDGLIASDGALDVNLSGAYSGAGSMTSVGKFDLKAARLDLTDAKARLASGGNSVIDIDGILATQGRITSSADMQINAGTVNNFGTLGATKDLTVNTPSLLNQNGLIFSGGNMSLLVNDFTNKTADVYSMGNLRISRDAAGAFANSIINRSGTLTSDGSMLLAANSVQNIRDVLTVNDAGIYSGRIDELSCTTAGTGNLDCSGGKEHHVWKIQQLEKLEVTGASAASSITSGGNMTLQGGDFLNSSSTVASGGTLSASFNNFQNIGVVPGKTQTDRVFVSERTRNDNGWENAASTFNQQYSEGGASYNVNNLSGLEAAMSNFISLTEREVSELRTINKTVFDPQTYAAVIQAGGAVDIRAGNNFDNSVVQRGFTYVSGGARTDTSAPGSTYATAVPLNRQLAPDLTQQPVNPTALPGFSLPTGQNGLFRLSDSQSATDLQGSGAQLLGVARSAQPHRYLIETNPALTDLRQFLSSSYLLDNIGYNPDAAWKRLGDGYYEQRLIQQSVVARTGQRFIDGLTSDEAVFKYLMDNAIASKDPLNLSVGVALTGEQVAALTHDIVWMEDQVVRGEHVLVPVLYLAQANNRLANNGALIQGSDVNLMAGNNLSNVGVLRASGNLRGTAGNSLINDGLVQANERLNLQSNNDLINRAGGIVTGRDVALASANGDVTNERTVVSHQSAVGASTWREDFANNAARVESANDLILSAGRDVNNAGGVLQAGRDANLVAGRDVTVTSVQTQQGRANGPNHTTSSTTQLGATVTAGQDINAQAKRDIAVTASQAQAGRDVALRSAGNIKVDAAADESEYVSRNKKTTLETRTVSQQGSELKAGSNLALDAGQNLDVVASRVNAGGNVALDAAQDMSIASGLDENSYFYSKKSKGSFGRSSSKQQESYDSTNVASEITAGQDLTVNASKAANGGVNVNGGRDVSIIGSQLTAGNDLIVGATRDVAVLSGVEEHGAYTKTSKSGFMGLSKSGKSELKTSATQVASELNAGEDAVIASGKDIRLRASEVSAGNDVDLRAGLQDKTGDINLISANDEAYSRSEAYKKKTGLSVSGGFLSISSAKEAGRVAQSTTSVGSQVNAVRDAGLQAERDINVIGSSINAGGNVRLNAGQDVNVLAAQNSNSNQDWEKNRQSGIGVSSNANGVTFFAGVDRAREKNRLEQQTAAASQIRAGEDLDVTAKRDINQSGSDLEASNNINLTAGRNIKIDAAREKQLIERQRETERNGLSLSLNHNYGSTRDAVSGAAQGDDAVSKGSSTLRAVDSVGQFLSGPTGDLKIGNSKQSNSQQVVEETNRASTLNAGNDLNLLANNDVQVSGGQLQAGRDINVKGRDVTLDAVKGSYSQETRERQSWGGIHGGTSGGIKLGIGGSNGIASGDQSQESSTVTALQAGRDVNLQASNDLNLIGTQVQARRDIDLRAGNDLNIKAAQNNSTTDNTRKNGGGEAGFAFGPGGIGVYASVNIGKGDLEREGLQQQEAYLYAGNRLGFTSGQDTNISGATLRGNEVVGRVGRDLNVTSVANTGKVEGKEYDLSATVVVGFGGSVSGSAGYGQTNGSTHWIEQQTSITGKDQVDIRTGNHTQLDGALIASDTGNLKLDTNTLGFSDIAGKDKEHGYYLNVGGSYGSSGGAVQDQSQVGKGTEGDNGWSLEGWNYEKDRQQIVRGTVGAGDVVVRGDAAAGKDSTAGLNRDVTKAYEITRDDEHRTDLYASDSSLDAARKPIETTTKWTQELLAYDDTARQNFENATRGFNRAVNKIESVLGRKMDAGASSISGAQFAERTMDSLLEGGMTRTQAMNTMADPEFQAKVMAEVDGLSKLDLSKIDVKQIEAAAKLLNTGMEGNLLYLDETFITESDNGELTVSQEVLRQMVGFNQYVADHPGQEKAITAVVALAQGPKGLLQAALINALSATPPGEEIIRQIEAYNELVGTQLANGLEGRILNKNEAEENVLIGGGEFFAGVLTGVIKGRKGKGESKTVTMEPKKHRLGEGETGGGGTPVGAKGAGEVASIGGKTCVYNCVVDGVTRYVGITDDIVKRGQAHLREKGITIDRIEGLQNLSRADARAVEQTLIDYHGLGKDGGTLINKINSISSVKNPTKYEQGLIRGAELLKKAGYEGF